MKIELQEIGRRYNQNWIFRNFNGRFESNTRYAILGSNGSGKSTFLKVLSGALTPSEGKIRFHAKAEEIDIDKAYTQVSYAAPYIELLEEFTLDEMMDFHFRFKKMQYRFSKEEILSFIGLKNARFRELRYFSSGMKQRVKLALACFADSPLVLLDEPASNLDSEGEQWYLDLVEKTWEENRILVVASNRKEEYGFCTQHIYIKDYK